VSESGSGVVNALNGEVSGSSPFGAFLTFFCFTALMLLVAFRLPFPVAVLAFDARLSTGLVLDVVGCRFFFNMVDE
jgi:hypothetical protein